MFLICVKLNDSHAPMLSRIDGTNVSASTIHNLFDLDHNYESKLDFSKGNLQKVAELVQMQALLLDEVSMLDRDIFMSITRLLNLCDHTRKGRADLSADEFGNLHMILFGDFKQSAARDVLSNNETCNSTLY